MSYPTTNDTIVSPQTTGMTNTGTFPSHGIEAAAAPTTPAPAYNEKIDHGNADAQYPMATPQQEHVNAERSPAGQFKQYQEPQQQNGPPRNQYQVATALYNLRGSPAPVDCPACRAREMTRTEFISGGTTHGMAALFCCIACLGCIPYMASWFKDCEHKCGNCNTLLAVWHRSGRTEVMVHA